MPLDERTPKVDDFFRWLRNGLDKELRSHLRKADEPRQATHVRMFAKLVHMIESMEEFHFARFSNSLGRRRRAYDAARQLLSLREVWRQDDETSVWLACLDDHQINLVGREYPSFARCVLDLATDHEDPLLTALRIQRIVIPTCDLGNVPQFWNEQRFVELCGSLDKMDWMSFDYSCSPQLSERTNGSGTQEASQADATSPKESNDIVDTGQIAAIARVKSNKTILRWLNKPPIILPHAEGGGGKTALWCWPQVRSRIEEGSRRQMPEQFPQKQMSED